MINVLKVNINLFTIGSSISSNNDSNQSNFEKFLDQENNLTDSEYESYESQQNIHNISNIDDNIDDNNDSELADIEDLIDTENNFPNHLDVDSDFDLDTTDSNFEQNIKQDSILDYLMFEESTLLVRDVVTMISAFSLRFSISDVARLRLMNMFKLCAGSKFDDINISKYKMEQCVSNQDEHIRYFYYCEQCSNKIFYSMSAVDKLKTRKCVCENCKTINTFNKFSTDYFITIDLAHQLQQVLSNPELSSDLLHNLSLRNNTSQSQELITDIHGGQIQQNIVKDVNNKFLILLNFITDGAPLTKSGNNAFWPLQVIINSLSPKLRFKNVLIAGILIVKREPKPNLMNLYMSQFVNQMKLLYEHGITIRKNKTEITYKFITHSCLVDSVGHPIMQNRLQFNG